MTLLASLSCFSWVMKIVDWDASGIVVEVYAHPYDFLAIYLYKFL